VSVTDAADGVWASARQAEREIATLQADLTCARADLSAFHDLAAHDAVGVNADPVRGHIAVTVEEGRGLTFADLGPVLSAWSHEGADLTPDLARQLGQALLWWACRKAGDST